MGSRPRKSISRSPARSDKSEATPSRRTPDPAEILDMLNGVRSIFACSARTLDDISEPCEPHAPERCGPKDVVVVVRLGIQKLDEVHEALDLGLPVAPREKQ
jgi:hypothetical protein